MSKGGLKITTDVFSIPHGKKFIIYAPFKRLVFLANQEAAGLIARMRNSQEPVEDGGRNSGIISFLKKHGVVNGEPDKVPSRKALTEFKPTKVTIFPTSDCNLRCIYCYASGGENPHYIDIDAAKAALDLIVRNALETSAKKMIVGFHGGGDPLLAWDTVVKCVEYSKDLAKKHGLKLIVSAATNGVFGAKQAEWVLKNMNSLNISLDGPKDVQDEQRPFPDGSGSYDTVFRTLKSFDKAGFRYGLRSTVSEKSVHRISEFVDLVSENFSAKNIHFEPLFGCGRCLTTKCSSPAPDVFAHEFSRAAERAKSRGIKLYYSGSNIGPIKESFCGAAGTNFCVTPNGFVTSCYEVSSIEDPRSGLFFYGSYNKEKSAFDFDLDKLNTLRERTVKSMEHCSDCFCKWHCAGDCLAKVLNINNMDESSGSWRCHINRNLMKQELLESLKNNPISQKTE